MPCYKDTSDDIIEKQDSLTLRGNQNGHLSFDFANQLIT